VKAIVHEAYGPPREVLELRDVEEPVAGHDQVLVRVHAASANPADWHFIRGDPWIARTQLGLRRPKVRIPGCDMAGEVEAVGREVTTLRPGDEVFGSAFMRGFGAFGERAPVAAELVAKKPANLSFEQAAAVPLAAMTALQALRDHGRVEPGRTVLIVGASGGVGTFAVQIAKHLGAEVTGVCSAGNVELVRSLGADHVVDYTREDFISSGQRYDVVLQLAGTLSPVRCRRALAPKGTLIVSSGESNGHVIGPVGRALQAAALSPFLGQRLLSFTVSPNAADLRLLAELIGSGRVAPVIDRTCPLAEVPDAISYLEEGHARGKVVIGM
jgi:NADPH:quinone reductase-like Zn-dependent oxidoreductase